MARREKMKGMRLSIFRNKIHYGLFWVMVVFSMIPLGGVDAATIQSSTGSSVCIKSMTVSPTTNAQVGSPVTVTVDASSSGGQSVYYKFFYCGNYGTASYDTSPWVVVQNYSTTNSANFNFPSAGNYIIVVRAVTDPNNEPVDFSIIGEAVTVGNSNQVIISSFTSNVTPSTKALDTVTFTASARTQSGAPIYYEFYYCGNYGTNSYASTPWTKVQSYSTNNSCPITFPSAGNYVVVVRAVTNPSSQPAALPIVGTVVRVNAADNSALGAKVTNVMSMFSTGSDMFTPLQNELSRVFTALSSSNSTVPVTITPPMSQIDLENPPPAVTINLNYGSGYTASDGSTMSGSLVISLTGISVTNSGISLTANLSADQLKRNGTLILDCDVSLTAVIGTANNLISADISIQFTQWETLAGYITGKIDLDAAGISLQAATFQQPITIGFTNFLTNNIDILSGTLTVTNTATNKYELNANMTTSEGPISGKVTIDSSTTGQTVINSVGNCQIEDYVLDINDVVFKPAVCDAYPVSGNIIITQGSDTRTMTFSGNCDSYSLR